MSEGRDSKGRFIPGNKTQFELGNKFWQTSPPPFGVTARSPAYATAEELHAACLGYFNWTHENPLFVDELVKFEGRATHEPVAKMRAMTNVGLCMHIGISRETWSQYRANREDLREVIAWADDVCYRQKFEGAAAGLLNPNIIARDLGLAEKREMTGADGAPLITQIVIEAATDDDSADQAAP